MPGGSTVAEVPITRRYPNLRFGSLWSRGWESNPLQPSIPGCLLRVATRCFCSPSPEPIGLRWTCQPRPRCPRRFGLRFSEPYKLVENWGFFCGATGSRGDPVPNCDEFQSSEYLVPYLACYLQCAFFRIDVPD